MRIQTPVEVIGNKVCTKARDVERLTIATTNEKAFGPTPWADDIGIAINSYEAMKKALELCKRNVESQLYMLPINASQEKDILSSWIGSINNALALAEGKE
jgi:hypothetical protein